MTALQSLYNSTKSRSALAGNVGGLPRVQEVLTPEWILDAVRAAFGGFIGFDPCASTNKHNWFATENRCLPVEASALQYQIMVTPKEHRKELTKLRRELKNKYVLKGALVEAWPERPTFVNPHFDTLKPWMRKVNSESDTDVPRVLLCPVRTHRTWWVNDSDGAYAVWLAPFPFVGSKSSFPAPLCLLARNCEIPPLGKRETGRRKL